MEYKIKNWDKFQHYKDDRPVHWIKLHVDLINDYHFEEMSETDQLYLIKLWLFAAKNNGVIEGSDAFITRKIGAKKLNMERLINQGFILRTDSYDTVPREEERRGEKSAVEPSVSHEDIIAAYHGILPELSGVIIGRWDGVGMVNLKKRIQESDEHKNISFWEWFFGVVKTNDHWMGGNDRKWKADLRWLIKSENFTKVIERGMDK